MFSVWYKIGGLYHKIYFGSKITHGRFNNCWRRTSVLISFSNSYNLLSAVYFAVFHSHFQQMSPQPPPDEFFLFLRYTRTPTPMRTHTAKITRIIHHISEVSGVAVGIIVDSVIGSKNYYQLQTIFMKDSWIRSNHFIFFTKYLVFAYRDAEYLPHSLA